MLVLFDIDGTLLLSDGAGLRAMEAAASELVGRPVSCGGVSFAGSLDPVIWRDLCALHDIADGEALHDRFRALYTRRLLELLPRSDRVRALPGMARLLDRLEGVPSVVLGLLTGNYPETGRAKVDAAGLRSARFSVAAWGDDGARRPDLLPVAARRCAEQVGRVVAAAEIVIVGDTPADVATATAHGCRCLAVATGQYSSEQLAACGATLTLQTVEQTEAVVDWLLG